jgi:formate--tetrahydrofolate ligase
MEEESRFTPLYSYTDSINEKINKIATEIYGADGVVLAKGVKTKIKKLVELGYDNLPICMAKTQYSFSDNPKALGRPTGFDITISDVVVNAGAGFIVALTGDIMRMPGLPKVPAANHMDIDENGIIKGLF